MSGMHEDFRPKVASRGPSDRSFGWVIGCALLFFGVWPLRHHLPVRPLLPAAGGLVVLVAMVRPSFLHPANMLWTRLGLLPGKVVQPVVTAVLFYLVFTPVATILRWTGKDLLGVLPNPGAETYWVSRDPKSQSESSMVNQF